jgi:hypothetical protein
VSNTAAQLDTLAAALAGPDSDLDQIADLEDELVAARDTGLVPRLREHLAGAVNARNWYGRHVLPNRATSTPGQRRPGFRRQSPQRDGGNHRQPHEDHSPGRRSADGPARGPQPLGTSERPEFPRLRTTAQDPVGNPPPRQEGPAASPTPIPPAPGPGPVGIRPLFALRATPWLSVHGTFRAARPAWTAAPHCPRQLRSRLRRGTLR